ncbi:rare lipoA family protein [Bordetella holmesii 35009]|nr:rare lipoA family protein [Bordetella holmesii 35009]
MRSPRALMMLLLLAVVLAGCSTPGKRGGGYYKDDGPDANPPANLDSIPDAVPRLEPLASGANRPYVVFGKRYVPDLTEQAFRQEGIASWYGKKFHGNSTSIGEPYDMYSMTAAHPTMPVPSYARVTSKVNGRSVIVRVNDRGPFTATASWICPMWPPTSWASSAQAAVRSWSNAFCPAKSAR